MPNLITKAEKMTFDYHTTYMTDFRFGELHELVSTDYKEKPPSCPVTRPPPCKNVHTLTDWKHAPVPFGIFHTPKEIIGENPMKLQPAPEMPIDVGLDEAIRTRPRIVMTPAISMDDIENPRARAILCDDMYTTDMNRGAREAVAPYFSVRAPLPDLPSPANPVNLRQLQPPAVSPEWRKETVTWEKNQRRGFIDTTKEFWCNRELSRCIACEESARVAAHRKMQRQVATRR